MKKILTAVLLLAAMCCHGQRIELPYEIVAGKMVVRGKIDERPVRFIFDTGGQTAVLSTIAECRGLSPLDSITVTDANSVSRKYPRAGIGTLTLGDPGVNIRNVPAMVLEGDPFECFGCQALIGHDILKNFTMEIDARSKMIRLDTGLTPQISLRNMVKFVPVPQDMPVIPVTLKDGRTIDVLFDTGSASFISLKESDLIPLAGTSSVAGLTEGVGGGSIGIAGRAGHSERFRLVFPELTVGVGKFSDVTAQTSPVPYTLLGIKLLEHGRVTIDYKNSRFFFEPYETGRRDAYEKRWTVDMTVVDGDLVISQLWGDMMGMARPGDKVEMIDDVPVGKLGYCEVLVNGLDNLKGKEEVTLTIHSGGESREISIYKK